MKQRRRNLWIGIIGLTVLAFLVGARLHLWEPKCEERPLSYWVAELKNANPGNQQQARKVLCEIGPQAIPFLLRNARHKDSVLKRLYREAWLRLPSAVQQRLRKPEDKDVALYRITLALQPLGRSAVPALMAALGDQNRDVQSVAGLFFMRLSQDDPPAAVLGLARMLEIPDDELRQAAAGVLGTLGANAKPAIPALVRTMQHDKWDYVRETAARALAGLSGPETAPAAPGLRESLSDRLASVRLWSAIALWRIDRDPSAIAILVGDLKTASAEDGTCHAVIRVLGEAGPLAKSAVPAIRAMMLQFDPERVLPEGGAALIQTAREALVKIDSETTDPVDMLVP